MSSIQRSTPEVKDISELFQLWVLALMHNEDPQGVPQLLWPEGHDPAGDGCDLAAWLPVPRVWEGV